MKSEIESSFGRSLIAALLPSDWGLVAAGDVLLGTEYGLSEPGASEGSTPIVGMKDIVDGRVRLDNLATVNAPDGGWPHLHLKAGDILLNRTNSPDQVGKVGIVVEDADVVFASYLVRLATDRDVVDPLFLNYWLLGDIGQRALKRLSTRAVSQANINPTEFRRHCPVPLPPLPEQRKIAEILQAWDEAIENAAELVKLREAQYVGLRDRLINWKSIQQSRLNTLVEPVTRAILKPEREYRALSIRSHGKGTFLRMVGDPSSVEMHTLFVARAGDLIINITFAWEGAVALVPPEHDGALVSHRFPTFIPRRKKVDPSYLRHAVRMRRFTYLLGLVSPGGAGRNRVLNKADFLALQVPSPDLARQGQIATCLDAAEGAIARAKDLRDALARQKRGLMQKLLTGEWRVSP